MLEKCKIKDEDFEKFKKDQIEPEILEKYKRLDKTTIRSRAAKAIEKISSTRYYFIYKLLREIPDRGVFLYEECFREIS
jgi:hypothetical protein